MGDDRYRIHWIEQAGDGVLARWRDASGVDEARRTGLEAVRASVEGSVRVGLADGRAEGPMHVVTGAAGLRRWTADAALPPVSTNPWATRLADERARRAAADAIKARLIDAHEAGLIDIDAAARVAATLDLGLSTSPST